MTETAEPTLSDLYTVLAFDPGGTTGWAVISLYDGVIGPPPFPLWLARTEYNRGGRFASQVRDSGLDWLSGDAEAMEALEAAKMAYKAEQAEAAGYKILDNVAFWSCGEFIGDRGDQVDAMIALTQAWPDDAPIIHEAFILRTFRMDPMLLEPVRITERYRHALRDLGPRGPAWRTPGTGVRRRDVIQQPASIAKTMVTDDRLRRMEVPFFPSTAGKPHARDGVRHALTFLRREKEARTHGKSLHLST